MTDTHDHAARDLCDLAMAMPDAAAAIAAFMNNAPPMPDTVGTDEHDAFLAGKDSTIAVLLVALRADHRSGAIKNLDATAMLTIGKIVCAVDQAISAMVGVDIHGLPLPAGRA